MKKFRKSFLAVVLAMVMVMGLSVTSFADYVPGNELYVVAFSYDAAGNCIDGIELGMGDSYTFYVPAFGMLECIDGNPAGHKTVKIYLDGELQLTYKKNEDATCHYNTSTDRYITLKINKKGTRIDLNTKEVAQAAPAAPAQAAPAAQAPATEVSTAAEAQQLADYYAAYVKKNGLAGTNCQEEQLAAYYKSLAKKLK